MKQIILTIFAMCCSLVTFPQGCIPIRNLAGFGQFSRPEADPLTGEPTRWLLNINQRYFESSETYSGDSPVSQPWYQLKTTRLYVMDIAVARLFENGWSVAANVPLLSGTRTAWTPEHFTSDTTFHTTSTFGIGDVRISVYKWLWDVQTHYRWNVQLGLGLKLPTGDYRAQDFFYRNDTTTVLAPVNPTIQLGDGGTGITTELNAFYNINPRISLYANAFYLFNPRDQNGVSNTYGGPASVPGYKLTEIPSYICERATSHINSVPDAYTLRAGVNYLYQDFTFWAGARMEGAPVHDVIGDSNGQRRAGKIISVEPGINYKIKRTTLYTFVTVPLYRRTEQTVPDQRIAEWTGKIVPSPGGFAKYLIFFGIVVRI